MSENNFIFGTSGNLNQQLASTAKNHLTFKGLKSEDIEAFIQEFQECISLHTCTEEQAKYLLNTLLLDDAKQWYCTMNKNQPLNSILHELLVRFQPSDKLALALNTLSDTPFDHLTPLLSYLDKMKLTAMRGGVGNEVLLAMVYKNMPSEVQSKITMMKQASTITWELIYYIARHYDETPRSQPLKGEFLAVHSKQPLRKWNSKNTVITNTRYTSNKYDERKFCKFHNKKGHWTSECRKAKEVSAVHESYDTQDKCDVTESIETNKSVFNYSIFSQSNVLPTVNIHVNGKVLTALVDTGSEINLIEESPCIDNRRIKNACLKISAANNTELRCLGILCNLKIKIDNTIMEDDFVVTKGLTRQCILGMPFLIKYAAGLYIDKKTIKVRWKIDTYKCNNISDVVNEFRDLFIIEPKHLKNICVGKHFIQTGSASPIAKPPYHQGSKIEAEISKEVEKLLEAGIIRRSKSPWRSRAVAQYKKNGKFRLCIDFRPLNEVTKKDAYTIPRIDDILDFLGDGKIFSVLDWYSGYYQIKMNEEDIEKTAFACRKGCFEFTRMPFGLVNAPATFQRLIDDILKEELWEFCVAYLDDLIIKSNSIEEHKEHLKIIFSKLKSAGVKLNLDKCVFYKKEINVLGHIISNGYCRPDPERIKCIKDFIAPTTYKQLQSFLGLVSYCRKFIHQLAEKAKPLYKQLTEKEPGRKLILSSASLQAFNLIKCSISIDSLLQIPNLDKQLILTTDASNNAIGATLSQLDTHGIERTVSYFSRLLSQAQKNYSTTDRELLAVIESIKHFRHYLAMNTFKIRTDHKPITYLLTAKNLTTRLARWSLALQEYKFELEYLKGSYNHTDYLSRIAPQRSCIQSCTIHTCHQMSKHQKVQIPTGNKQETLKFYHELTGHGGEKSLKYHITRKYEWRGLDTEIRKYISECELCQLNGKNRKESSLWTVRASNQNEIWQIDMIGPLPESTNGSKYILTVIDNFTKMAIAIPCRTKNGTLIAGIVRQIIKNYGKPRKIISDNGLEFKNLHCTELANSEKFTWAYSSPYHPQTNGTVERFNGTILSKLRKLSKYGIDDWEIHLKAALEGYMNSYNRAIGMTPNEYKFGRMPIYHQDIKNGITRKSKQIKRNRLKTYIRKHRERYIQEYATSKKIPNKFYTGDAVYYYDGARHYGKLESKWRTGFRVIEAQGRSYRVRNEAGATYQANENMLKKDYTRKNSYDREEC